MTPDVTQQPDDATLQQENDALVAQLTRQNAGQQAEAKGELEANEHAIGVQNSVQQEQANGSGSEWNFDADARDEGDYSFGRALGDEIKGDIRGIGRGIAKAPFQALDSVQSAVASTGQLDAARLTRAGRPDLATRVQQRSNAATDLATQADAAGNMYADAVAPQQQGVGNFTEKATSFGLNFAALPKAASIGDVLPGAPAVSRFIKWAVPAIQNTVKAGAAGSMTTDASQGETAGQQFKTNAEYGAAAEVGVGLAGQAVRLYKYLRGLDAAPKIPLTGAPGSTAGDGTDTTVPVTDAERRTTDGAADRARIDALPADQQAAEIERVRAENADLKTQLRTNPKSGLPNQLAYNEANKDGMAVASVDGVQVGKINKVMGYTKGDEAIKATADTLQSAVGSAGRVYHITGDEFRVLGADPELLADRLKMADDNLKQHTLVSADADATHTRNGLGINFGVDAKGDFDSADSAMQQQKAERTKLAGQAAADGYISSVPHPDAGEPGAEGTAPAPKPASPVETKPALPEPENAPITPEDIQGKRYGSVIQIDPAHSGAFMQFMNEGAISDAMKLAKVNGAYLTPEVMGSDVAIRALLRGAEDEIGAGTDSFGTNYRIPDGELAKFAQQTGKTPEQLMKLHQDVKTGGGLAARLFATGSIPQVFVKRAADAAKAAVADDSSDNIADAFNSIYEAAMADATVRANTSEVGRALRAARLVKEQKAAMLKGLGSDGLDQLMQQVGGRNAVVDKFLSDLATTPDAGQLGAKIRQFNRGSLWTRIQNAMVFNGVSSMISSGMSLGRNLAGNAFNATWDTLQGLGAMGIGSTRKALGADAAYDAQTFYNAHITGKWAGLKAAFRIDSSSTGSILKAIQDGRIKGAYADAAANKGVGSVYRTLLTGHQAVDTAQQPLDATLGGNPIGDLVTEDGVAKTTLNAIGNVISIPGRLHMASDDLWKEMNVRSALVEHSTFKAEQEAADQGLTGTDFDKERARLIAKFVAEKPDDVADAAMTDARRNTLTDKSPFANNLQKVLTADGKLPIGRLLSPFTRITANMVRTAARKSPLGFLASDQLASLKAGGAQRDKVLAGMGMSWGLSLGAYEALSRGWLTGGGPSGTAKTSWLLDNKPYTLKVGDDQVDYRSLGAFGLQLGLLSDYHEAVNNGIDPASQSDADKAEQVLGAMWVATGRDVTSATTLTGISTFLDALQDESGNKMQKWLRAIGDSQIPYYNLGKDLAHDTDPVYRDARSYMDDFRAALPGLSGTLPPKRNVLGEPLKVDGKLGPDWISPISISPTDTDPVHKALASMDKVLEMPPRTLHTYGNGPSVKMTPQQYSDYLEIRGQDPRVFGNQSLSARLNQLITSREWASTPAGQDGIPGGRELEVQKLFTLASRRAQILLIQKYPDLKQQLTDAAHRASDVRSGLPLPN